MPETYSLILNSQNSTNIINNSSLANYQYNIRWDSILPRINPNQKYSVTWQLKSANLQTSIITGAITGTTTLTASSVSGGSIVVGTQFLIGNVLQTITAFGTGTGANGTYTVSPGGNAASATYYSLNTSLTQNIVCGINFGYTTTLDQTNNQNTKIGCVYPYTYPLSNTANISTFNYNCSVLDNGPTVIGYPSNQVITVTFTTIDGTTLFSQMPHYYLQLYFEPIDDE